jgi:hypothetical protein
MIIKEKHVAKVIEQPVRVPRQNLKVHKPSEVLLDNDNTKELHQKLDTEIPELEAAKQSLPTQTRQMSNRK